MIAHAGNNNAAKQTTIEMGRVKRTTFQQILRVANTFNKIKFDQGEMLYNYFRSVMTFEPTTVKLYSLDTLTNKTNIGEKYENEGTLAAVCSCVVAQLG